MRRAIASATLLLLAVIVAALIVSLVLLPSTSSVNVRKSELSFPTSLYARGLSDPYLQEAGADTGDLRERVLLIYGGAATLVLLISASVLILVRSVPQTPDS